MTTDHTYPYSFNPFEHDEICKFCCKWKRRRSKEASHEGVDFPGHCSDILTHTRQETSAMTTCQGLYIYKQAVASTDPGQFIILLHYSMNVSYTYTQAIAFQLVILPLVKKSNFSSRSRSCKGWLLGSIVQLQHEGDDESVHHILAQHSKRRREDINSQQPETSVFIGNLWSRLGTDTDMIRQHMADLVARIVREEFERRLLVPRPTVTETRPVEAKFFKLAFESVLPHTLYTSSDIKAKDDDDHRLVEIALYDIRSQSKVTAGSLSSINIEICVFDDDEFSSNGSEDWTTEQFKAKILRPRENKGRLLKGDVVIPLKNGVGYINKVVFTDNSSWTRRGHFRLGAFAQSTSNAAEVKEATSNRFMVKDGRGEDKQKRDRPFLTDPIWYLKNIARGGKFHQRMSKLKINTVKDLLHISETNPSLLQDQKSGRISARLQDAIKHAKTFIPEATSTCNLNEKRLETVQQLADRNAEDVFIPANQTSAHSFPRPLASLQLAGQCSAPDLQVLDLPTTAHQGQQEAWPGSTQPFISASNIDGEVANYQIFADPLPDAIEMPQNSYAEGELFSGVYIGGDNWHINGSSFPIVQGGYSP